MFCTLPSLSVLVFAPQISSCFGVGASCRADRLLEDRFRITIQALSQVLTAGKATGTGEHIFPGAEALRTGVCSAFLLIPAVDPEELSMSQVLQTQAGQKSHP